eukprot:4841935-Pyramimonas_sp.AAC.1
MILRPPESPTRATFPRFSAAGEARCGVARDQRTSQRQAAIAITATWVCKPGCWWFGGVIARTVGGGRARGRQRRARRIDCPA